MPKHSAPNFLDVKRLTFLLLMLTLLLSSGCSVFAPVESRLLGNVPYAAKAVVRELDSQLVTRHGSFKADEDDEYSPDEIMRSKIMIMGTTPVNVNSLDQSCPLARQMTEEISSQLMQFGYRYEELRKGKYIRFDRSTGELSLTRNVKELTNRYGRGQAILVGTYVISIKHVRFSFSLINTSSNEVLAKASATIPITEDILNLLDESPMGRGQSRSYVPSTYIWMQ